MLTSELSSLLAAARAGRDKDAALLDGVFKKMLEPKEFQALVYPGLRVAELQRLPTSLQEVLADPRYAKDVEQLVPVAKAKAKSVLDAVKVRAAAEGDVMDAATEASLYPAVFQEAFARALVSMVTSTAVAAQSLQVRTSSALASPFAAPALWEQLHAESLRGVMSAGFAVQDAFCGPGWPELYVSDLQRMLSKGRFTRRSGQASASELRGWSIAYAYTSRVDSRDIVDVPLPALALLDAGELEKEYPALADLCQRLHALPFELNRKAKLGLTVPAPRATAAECLDDTGTLRLPACDSGPAGSPTDQGIKLTATLFLSPGWSSGCGGELGLRGVPSASSISWIEPVSDRLVLHRARQHAHVIKPVTCGPVWILSFHMHGLDDAFG